MGANMLLVTSVLQRPMAWASFVLLSLFGAVGCTAVDTPDHDENHENEVMTTVELTFAPQAGGDDLLFTWDDPENDGDPVIDDIVLSVNETYAFSLRFINRLASPSEDVTPEIWDERNEHQVFVYGNGVEGPATVDRRDALVAHSYEDVDDNGLPVGLTNALNATEPGSRELSILLRHMPTQNDAAIKIGGLGMHFATGGQTALPGSTDINVTFPLVVE